MATQSEFAAVESTCESAGGNYELAMATYTCPEAFLGLTWVFNFPYARCFGASCSDEYIKSNYTDLFNSETTDLASYGYTCTYEYTRQDVETPSPTLLPTTMPTTLPTQMPTLASSSGETGQPVSSGNTAQPGSSAMPTLAGSSAKKEKKSGSNIWTTFVSGVLLLCSVFFALW